MKRLLWWIGGNILVLALLFGGAWLWFRPTGGAFDADQSVFAHVGSQFVEVSYLPGKPEALVRVRLDGLGRYAQVEYQIQSTQPWAPQWQARTEGHLSEFLTLNDGYSESPQPMTRERAEQLARSYTVLLRRSGAESKFDFSTAGIGHTTPVFSISR